MVLPFTRTVALWMPITALVLSVFLSEGVVPVHALSGPSHAASCAAPSPAFGLSDVITNLRGGEVHDGSAADDVAALILRAGSEQQLVVIDFTATWCGPCKMIAPVFKELSESFADVVFIKVDVDENPETAAQYSVSAMPTFVFIKGGEVVDRLMGADPARLEALINELK